MAKFQEILNKTLLLTPDKKGKLFEFYCKWFLENDPSYSTILKKVWLWKDWPENWGRDKGIDLIAEDYSGKIWAIQAKAYNPDYYVTKEDIDTFLSESGRKQIYYRLLIATTNNIGHNANEVIDAQEKLVGKCLLEYLDSSSIDWPDDITNLDNYKKEKKEIKSPKFHQVEAIQSILSSFEKNSIGQVHMACGTGKTLVGLWVAEKLQSNLTLVLVPSISLVSQLYNEWVNCRTDEFDFHPIFICSDNTVYDKEDESENIKEKVSDLGFPVTTNTRELLNEINSINGKKVIFSTYQSSPIIKEACSLDKKLNFDLAIADEAHRCAGKAKSYFATIVDKNDIRVKHKLFMTATPRIFSDNVKNITKEIDCEIVSMDEEEQFGPVFYKLPFSEAIKNELLSDYQVLISVMDNKTYQEYAERGRFISINNFETDARTLASQILVLKAIKEYNLKKIITFHNRKKNATEFIDNLNNTIELLSENEKPIIESKNVIFGETLQSERLKILKKFKENQNCSMLANVKCLSEGVDVPALDGIVFIDPKGSEIEIVQAVGRVIRKPKNQIKKTGTIIIPIFIDDITDEENALNDSSFKIVWKVIKALRAHDDILGEELDNIRLELGKRTYKNPPKLNKIIIDLPVKLDLNFVDALKIKAIENIVQNCSSYWSYRFSLLKEFREIFERWPRKKELFRGEKLGVWYGAQQHCFKNNLLEDYQVKLLLSIGFNGDLFNSKWDIQFNHLKQYRQLNPVSWVTVNEEFPEGNKLGAWCCDQRENYRKGKLNQLRIEKLNSIEFLWNPLIDEWKIQYNHLKEFRNLFKNRWPKIKEEFPKGNKLGRWCSIQREAFKKGNLSDFQIKALESLNFIWNNFSNAWDKQLEYLKEYRKLFPDKFPTQREEFPPGNKLGYWCSKQRLSNAKNKLNFSNKFKLESLGFDFNKIDKTWDEQWLQQLNYLKEFRKLYPNRWPKNKEEFPEGNKLGSWCQDQRKKINKNSLSDEKKQRLLEINFPFKL